VSEPNHGLGLMESVFGTSMMTGQWLVLLCLTMLNCKQLWMGSVRPSMLVWRTCVRYMSSLIPQTCSVLPWTHLITQDNTSPSPSVGCQSQGTNSILFFFFFGSTFYIPTIIIHVLHTNESNFEGGDER
jgi:hypothetical protein